MKIPLFDIDGTLFKSANELHHEAFTYTCNTVFKVNGKKTDINPEGKTDIQIFLEVLEKHGLKEDEIKKKMNIIVATMNSYYEKNKTRAKSIPLSGVKDLLEKLSKLNITMGILSGNIEKIAWIRLSEGKLKEYFSFGAFGDMAYKRTELVNIAKINAQKVLNKEINKNDLLIIGDTPRDIECARVNEIKVIAVTTGMYSYEDLQKERPDLLLHTLEDTEKILNFLRN